MNYHLRHYVRVLKACIIIVPAAIQWPISETNIMCDSVTSFGGQIMEKNCEFLVFMDAEDSLDKVATRKKVYKCLEVC